MGSKASIIAGGNQGNREEHDFYPTPPNATESILKLEKLNGSIYECACGDGAISKVLKEFYPNQPVFSSDLIDRGYGNVGIDFLTFDYMGKKFDNIITNPPYRFATEFVKRALSMSNEKVLMLLKIQFLEGNKRQELFRNSPLKKVYVFSKRLNINKNGIGTKNSTMICFAWFVWDKNYAGKPEIDWV